MNLKLPQLQNLFMTAQGSKLPPSSCAASTDTAVFTHTLSQAPTSPDPKNPALVQDVASFGFEVWFDDQWICVNIEPGAYAVNNNMFCIIDDKNDGLRPDGMARIGCFTDGKPEFDESSLELARIVVRPQPELYSQLVANQNNGIPVQLLNKACNLADVHGHPIAKIGCDDSAVTVRWLEADVNGDCSVDAGDGQTLAFRWGAQVGSLLYSQRYDLEPSGTAKFDGDIDIKDIQFVFGRHGSTCDDPQPPQDPVNPKLPNP